MLLTKGVDMAKDKATPPRNESDADECRRKGWKRGTRLVGDEGYGPTVIQITAVGDEEILAREISHNGVPVDGSEWSWTLDCRKWKKVCGRDAMSDKEGGNTKPEHDWECVAPENGYYRWHCTKCDETLPYPNKNRDSFNTPCSERLNPPVSLKELWQCP